MYMLWKTFRFEASHLLPFHDGKCARLHGHSWRGIVRVVGKNLYTGGPKRGMLVDYVDIKTALDPLIEGYLDHYHLNDSLKMESPTCENIAKWVYEKLSAKIPELREVEIRETCTTGCIFAPDDRLYFQSE